jgi:sugar/nucleoside kinase (ribokinase family)
VALDTIETPFGQVEDALGGSATYAGTAASYFSPVGVVAVVGDDFPRKHLSYMKRKGIDTAGLQIVKGGQTFRWSGYYSQDLNTAHTRSTCLNVFESFRPEIPDSYREMKHLLLGNIDPELQLEVLKQARAPRLTLCDTMNFWITGKLNELLEVLKRVNVVCINDGEARQLCNEDNLATAAKEILKMGPDHVIIKKGEHGCLLFGRDSVFSAPAYPLKTLKDPTGAGDSFAGGFLGYLAGRRSLNETVFRQAIVVGTTLASFCCQGFSVTRSGKLKPADIAGRCNAIKDMADFKRIRLATR